MSVVRKFAEEPIARGWHSTAWADIVVVVSEYSSNVVAQLVPLRSGHTTSQPVRVFHAFRITFLQSKYEYGKLGAIVNHSRSFRPASSTLSASLGRKLFALSYNSVTAGYRDKSRPPFASTCSTVWLKVKIASVSRGSRS